MPPKKKPKMIITVVPTEKKPKWKITEGYPHRLYCSECYGTNVYNIELLYQLNRWPNYCMWCGTRLEEVDDD